MSTTTTTTENEMNTIGWAVKQLQDGQRVGRAGWNGRGMWLVLVRGSAWDLDRTTDLSLSKVGGLEDGYEWRSDFVAMRAVGGDLVPWLCSQTDLLATDWEIASVSTTTTTPSPAIIAALTPADDAA